MKSRLKNLCTAGLLSLFIANTVSATCCHSSPPMNDVTFTLTAQEWAKTDQAKVTVAVNATLNKMALAKMREQIMGNLNKIAQGSWHITEFERSQDSSGLEKLYVEAEARINEKNLSNVNAQATEVSQAGIKYKILNIDFTPSTADIEKVKKNLRSTIYRDAQTEIATLNGVYPGQKYVLHEIHFGEFVASSSAVRAQMMMVSGAAAPRTSSIVANTVSNLVTLTADVSLATEASAPSANASEKPAPAAH